MANVVTLNGGALEAGEIVDFDTQGTTAPATPAAGTIRLYARTAPSGLGALAYLNELGIPFVIARDRLFFAQNNTGATLTKGTPVYVSSASGGVARVSKAQADSGMTKVPAAGVVAADIANGAVGAVMTGGVLESMNTASFTDGATLYLSPTTAGVITATKPAHPQVIQPLGECIQAHSSNGILLVNVAEVNSGQFEGINGASWAIGDGAGTTKSLLFKNAAGTGTLAWNPSANRTLTLPDDTADILTISRSQVSNVTSLTPAITADFNYIEDTGLTGTLTINNHTGTPRVGAQLHIAATGTGARSIAYGSGYEDSGNVTRPTTTVGTNRLDMKFIWNPATSKMRILAYS